MNDNSEVDQAIKRLEFLVIAVERWYLSLDVDNCQLLRAPSSEQVARAATLGYKALLELPDHGELPHQVLFHRGELPEGWHVLQMWDCQRAGFKAVLYQSTFESAEQPVLVFGETEITHTNDLQLLPGNSQKSSSVNEQLLGLKASVTYQYSAAIVLGKQIANRFPQATVTGLALRGRLAMVVAAVTSLPAYTFDGADLPLEILASHGITQLDTNRKADLIKNFTSTPSPVSKFQHSGHANYSLALSSGEKSSTAAYQPPKNVFRGSTKPSIDKAAIRRELERQMMLDAAIINEYLAGKKPQEE